ncbi:MAG TPA: hypothetical protein PK430_01340 [Muribaculum sp.]|jgi:hypothetical protein|uniref:Uncharacterized protein n=1 Tax=Heminiphilus faecis TaxID=2601703 RepID=A0ABV4CV01_9BACT|nr:hypothetical protein [Heminiphilus faecis]RLT77508.1 hypothetical protein D7V95_03100 [bacterium J10(2018)]HRF67845.1 hypothetical protein [Muribaculum sp.]
MNKLIIGILSILVFIPVKSAGQSVEMPSTPQNQWVFIITSIKDSISQEAVPAEFKLMNASDSTVVTKGESSYESWTSDDGVHDMERIVFVIPDFRTKYILNLNNKYYQRKSVVFDFSDKMTLETPMKDRELKIGPIFLTKKQNNEQNQIN